MDLNSEETKTKNNLQSDSDELNDINKLQSNQPDDINTQADEAVTGEFGNTTWEFVDGTLTVSPIPNTDGKMGASDILNVYFSSRPLSNEITHIEIEPGVQLNDNVSDWNTSKVESMAAMF